MVDGSDQAAAFGTAFDRGLPGLLRAVRESVETGVTRASPATFALRGSLLACLRVAEWTAVLVLEAERVGGPAPANPGPQQILAPIGAGAPVDEEPLVPRRHGLTISLGGYDTRLPPGRPHP